MEIKLITNIIGTILKLTTMTEWGIAAGISTILGVSGYAIHAMFKSQENAINKENITPEIIRELKKMEVSIEHLREIPKNQRKEYLENSTKLSQSIIDTILVPQQNKRAKIALWFMILMFISLIISIGGWYFSTGNNTTDKNNQNLDTAVVANDTNDVNENSNVNGYNENNENNENTEPVIDNINEQKSENELTIQGRITKNGQGIGNAQVQLKNDTTLKLTTDSRGYFSSTFLHDKNEMTCTINVIYENKESQFTKTFKDKETVTINIQE